MSKKELANIIGEMLGVAKIEQRIALEAFLQKIADSLSINQTIKIPEVGVFHLKKISENSIRKTNIGGTKSSYQLLFAPSINTKGKTDFISFAVTPQLINKSESIDDAFSISIGKPLILLTNNQTNEFLYQSSFLLHNRDIEDKINEIIKNSISLKDLRIDYEYKIPDKDILESASELEEAIVTMVPEEKTPGIPWDFGIVFDKEDEIKKDDSKDIIPENENQSNLPDQNFTTDSSAVSKVESGKEISVHDQIPANKSSLSNLSTNEEEYNKKINLENLNSNAIPNTSDMTEKKKSSKSNDLTERLLINEKQQTKEPRRKSYLWLWISISVAVVIIAIGVFYFIFYSAIKRPVRVFRNQNVKTNLPVTAKDNSLKMDSLSTVKNNSPSNLKPDLSSSIIRNDNKTKMIKEYLYSDGSRYTLQLSSWKTQSVAENEVVKFRQAGYNAYIMIKNPNTSNVFYCVRIGEFSSLNEAEQFYKKLK